MALPRLPGATRTTTIWRTLTVVVAVVALGLGVQLAPVVRGASVLVASGPRPGSATRVIRFFCDFTVQSSLYVPALRDAAAISVLLLGVGTLLRLADGRLPVGSETAR